MEHNCVPVFKAYMCTWICILMLAPLVAAYCYVSQFKSCLNIYFGCINFTAIIQQSWRAAGIPDLQHSSTSKVTPGMVIVWSHDPQLMPYTFVVTIQQLMRCCYVRKVWKFSKILKWSCSTSTVVWVGFHMVKMNTLNANKSRLTVVSREAKEEAACGAPTDSTLTRLSIIYRYKSCENRKCHN